jgi:hypothetical protein
MTAPSMIEAAGKFAAALDELRRKHLGAFELWLDGALGKNPKLADKEIAERVARARTQFADEFINGRAPALLAVLNPDSKLDIIQQLRTFEAHADRVEHFDPVDRDGGLWRPGMLRTLAGAALGAALGVSLFLLQAGGPHDATVATTRTSSAQSPSDQPPNAHSANAQRPVEPATAPPAKSSLPNEAPPAVPRGNGPAIPPKQDAAPVGQRESLEWTVFLVLSGAFGAAIGTFIVLCPPLRRLTRMGFVQGALGHAERLGLAVLLLRGGVIASAVSVAVTAIAGLVGLLFTGPKPLWIALLGVAAVLLIVLLRSAFPRNDAQDRLEAARRVAVTALDRDLTIDSELWAALAAGLSTRPAGVTVQKPNFDQIKSIILARRDSAEPAEDILCIVEQELGLPTGPRRNGGTDIGASIGADLGADFIWESRHAEEYEPYGVVKAGDRVEVKVPPRMTKDARGVAKVFQKGTVVRKR